MIETVVRDRRSTIVGEKNMSHFPFRGSPNTQNPVTTTPPSPPAAPAMAVTSTVPPGARSSSPCSAASGPPNGGRCCETGRPIFTDPLSGQTVCSCQYDLINYQRLANASIAGPGGMPLSMYTSPYSGDIAGYFPALGADQQPFYANPTAGLDLKENLAASAGGAWPYPVYHSYDAAFAGYHFNGYGMDLNGARRKNATRETTSTLKAWLNEHKKNPYPTKGEKIMLAIITKMTLTQVSTWFANARRRLKKENKMTWEPRNRVDDDDANVDDDDHKSTDGKDLLDSGTASSEDGDRPSNRLDMMDRQPDCKSEWSESRPGSGPNSPDIYDRPPMGHPLLHPAALHHLRPPTGSPSDPNHTPGGSTNANVISKPRIWSLADMASNKDIKDDTNHHHIPPPGLYPSPGKIVSPLAGRMQIHHPAPYMRPELYRSFYSHAAQLPSGAASDVFMEYHRAFGPHNGLSSSMNPLTSIISKASGSVPPFVPLSLTTNTTTAPPSGASPSSSSSSSGPESTPTGLPLTHGKLSPGVSAAKP